jgi:toxin FitB
MSATRTQVYLTPDQRRRIDQVAQAEGVTLAEVVRRAADAYLADSHVDVDAALAATIGADPHATDPAGMNGAVADILVHTDLFIDHLRGAHELQAGKHRLAHSVLTRAELFAGTTATDAVSQLLAPFREFTVDRAVAERGDRIRREQPSPTAGALIAATALEHGLNLATRDPADFKPVAGLRLRALR